MNYPMLPHSTGRDLIEFFRQKLLLSGVLVALFSATSPTAQASPTYPNLNTFLWGNTSVNAPGQTSMVSGTGLGYRYILPKNFNPSVKYPTIIFLHGSGESGTNNTSQLTAGGGNANGALALVSTADPDNQTNYPCFFIAPQTNSSWSSDAAATEIQNLITTFKTQYPNAFDTDRIYLTGVSLGGIGTYDLAYLMQGSSHLGYNPFAALAPVCGAIGYFNTRAFSTQPNSPIWVFHGAQDGSVPISTSDDASVPTLRALGRSVIYTRYTTGPHYIWFVAYQHPQLLSWMFAQRLGQPAQGLSNLAITGSSQGTTLSLSGVASSSVGYTRIGWSNNPNTYQNPTPTPGSLTPTWSLTDIPLAEGSNLIQVFGEAPNNVADSTDYGGTTTINLPYTVIYNAHNEDTAAPTLAIVSPTSSATYSATIPSLSLSGTASDNVGVSQITWSNLTTGATGAATLNGTAWSISGVALVIGSNPITVTAKDSAGNSATATINATFMPTNYYLWKVAKFGVANALNLAISGDSADPDHDGIPNLLEYALSGVPTIASPSILPTADGVLDSLQFNFTRLNSSDLTYTVEASNDLTSWTAIATFPSGDAGWTGTASYTTFANVALNKTATASSIGVTTPASAAVDGSLTTRWSSAASDPQWIVVDLGANYGIFKIDLNWETACGKDYLIQTSLDGNTWTTQTTVTGNVTTGLLSYAYNTLLTARYIRIYGTARATPWGYSLYEISVYALQQGQQLPLVVENNNGTYFNVTLWDATPISTITKRFLRLKVTNP